MNGTHDKESGTLRSSKSVLVSSINSKYLETYASDIFRSLTESDAEARQIALQEILRKLHDSIKTPGKELVKLYASRIVRHSTEVPFSDIRTAFQNFIDFVEKVNKSVSADEPTFV